MTCPITSGCGASVIQDSLAAKPVDATTIQLGVLGTLSESYVMHFIYLQIFYIIHKKEKDF